MRVVCISDTHGMHRRMDHMIPDGDLLLHAGDVTKNGKIEDLAAVEAFFREQPHAHKVFTPGNHDWIFQDEPLKACEMVPSAICLIDQGIEIEGLKIWGSPWQPEFHNWAFNLPPGEALAEKWRLIPSNTDILLTHTPPADILDRCKNGEHKGCRDLAARLREISPLLNVFGHIHEAYGQETHGNTKFVNASICNLGYRPVNPPIVVDLAE